MGTDLLASFIPVTNLQGPRLELIPLIKEEQLTKQLFRRLCSDPLYYQYLPYGPFENFKEFKQFTVDHLINKESSFPYLIVDRGRFEIGMISFLNIQPSNGCLEIGCIWIGKDDSGHYFGFEAAALLISFAFSLNDHHQNGSIASDDMGGVNNRPYSSDKIVRVEWKTHHLNVKSANLAVKLGFTYEGCFRRHMRFKGSNRDTLWYSIIVDESKGVRENLQKVISTLAK